MDLGKESLSLTSFLFGNVDESGQLDTDILDSEAKKHLGSLTQLGLGAFVDELIGDEIPRARARSDSQSASDSEDAEDEASQGENSQGK